MQEKFQNQDALDIEGFWDQSSNYVLGRGREMILDLLKLIQELSREMIKIIIMLQYIMNGYQIPLFNMGDYDYEDREADFTYNTVVGKMEEEDQREYLIIYQKNHQLLINLVIQKRIIQGRY